MCDNDARLKHALRFPDIQQFPNRPRRVTMDDAEPDAPRDAQLGDWYYYVPSDYTPFPRPLFPTLQHQQIARTTHTDPMGATYSTWSYSGAGVAPSIRRVDQDTDTFRNSMYGSISNQINKKRYGLNRTFE